MGVSLVMEGSEGRRGRMSYNPRDYKTQKERVLAYMESYGSISGLEAFRDLGVYRLSAVIHTLRGEGYRIDSEVEHGQNRWGDPTKFARYHLKAGWVC